MSASGSLIPVSAFDLLPTLCDAARYYLVVLTGCSVAIRYKCQEGLEVESPASLSDVAYIRLHHTISFLGGPLLAFAIYLVR